MSERVGKIGLNACTPWSFFAENTAFEDSEGMADPKAANSEAARLHKEDMRLFGVCPAKDNLILAVCKECQKIVQASMLAAHYERKHHKVVNTLKRSPSRRCSVSKDIRSPSYAFGKSKLLKSPGDNSFIRIEEVDPTDINVKIEEVPLTIPKINHSSKGKLAKAHGKNMVPSKGKSVERQAGNLKVAQKKQVVNKDKEYDPERHCGVWIEDQTRNCTRSLTCKTHSLSSRREVAGRSKLFDVLLADHKARMQNSKESGSSSGATTPSATPSPTMTNTPTFPLKSERNFACDPSIATMYPALTPNNLPLCRSPPSKENSRSEGKRLSSADDVLSPFNQLQPTYVDYITEDRTSSMPSLSRHPKPMAVNTFSARRAGKGYFLFSRKFEKFRYVAQSMVDTFIRANSCTSNSQNSSGHLAKANRVCSNGDDGMNSRGATSSSFSTNSFSSTEPNRFGSVPRVKTKSTKTNTSTNLKRQISDSYAPGDYFSSRKRRHSSDSLKNDSVNKDSNLLENSLNENNNSRDAALDLEKCVNEIGQTIRGFDVESLDANFLSGDLLSSDSTQTGMSNLTISCGNVSTNLNANTSLNSSLSLCQTMSINHGISQNLGLNLGSSQNPIVVDHGQIVNQLLAPNMAVTKGMMVSLPDVTQVQNLAAYQGSLKEILPAPSSAKQQSSSTGLYVVSQGQQVTSQLSNGSVSSPETFSLSYNPGQSLSTANLNATLKASNTKRLTSSSSQRASQLVLRQPSQHQQQLSFQRDLNVQRSNVFQKPAPFDPHKGSSSAPNTPSPSRSPSQQPSLTAVTTQLLSTNTQYSTINKPITQLKQIQLQQLQQQEQQHLISPLNSTMQAEPLSYHQQILPKLVVSPGRNLPAQIVNTQAIQVNAQHLQQRSVLEPSTP